MPCYRPLSGWYSKGRNENGNRFIVFNVNDGLIDRPVSIPCGQCSGCRLDYSRQWALRCMHEASLHDDNCFITLTFDNEHLPEDKSLNVRDFQLFMKRLRKRFGDGIRFYHCGEYGETYGRPHYHAILFNIDFPDKELFRIDNGNRLYTSEILQQLWPFGFSTIGDVTMESCAYVARYVMKKIVISDMSPDELRDYYEYVNPDSGEISIRKKEYCTMSRRPAIAKEWFEKYHKDVYPKDYIVHDGKKFKPPKYYDRLFEIEYPTDCLLLKGRRKRQAILHLDNNMSDRLYVREQVQVLRAQKLLRNLEKEN